MKIASVLKQSEAKAIEAITRNLKAYGKAKKELSKLVYRITADVAHGKVKDTVIEKLGFDIKSEVQHVYQLRNLVAAIASGDTVLTEDEFESLPDSNLVAFHAHLGSDLELEAHEILTDEESETRARLIALGKPPVEKGPKGPKGPPALKVVEDEGPNEDEDTGEGEDEDTGEGEDEDTGEGEDEDTGATPPAAKVGLLSESMWGALADELETLDVSDLIKVQNIFADFSDAIAECLEEQKTAAVA